MISKQTRYRIEAGFLYLFYYGFKILPLPVASAVGGWIGRTIAYPMGTTKKALRNVAIAFPEKNRAEQKKIVRGMWDNLGRIFAEYPHLKKLESGDNLIIEGLPRLKKAVASKRPIIFITAHIGNWEVMPFVINKRLDEPLALVYRAPNNPWADRLIQKARGKGTKDQLTKGAKGAKEIVRIVRDGKHIGMLVDQKMNEGIPLPFFGKLAMTVTSVAQLALKYDAIVLPAYCVRLQGSTFKVIFEEPMPIIRSGDLQKDIKSNMSAINKKLEGWIRQAPEQWLWLHRRWPKSKNKPLS